MDITLDSIRNIKLYQPKHGYRFSVDSLLLYSFINLKHVKKIADLGAGSGIVGLLLSKKYPQAEVTLIELQESLLKLSQKNIILNELKDRVKAVRADLRAASLGDLTGGSAYYDLVVSNPPFRKEKTGLISPDDEKAVARHEIKLKLPELIRAAHCLLRSKGRFCLVYLPERLTELIRLLKAASFEPKRLRLVHSKKQGNAKMLLMEAVKHGNVGLVVEPPIFVYNPDGIYTDEMREMYGI